MPPLKSIKNQVILDLDINENMTFVFPRWLFPNNLGDSILATAIPRLLHKQYGERVDVITYGDDYRQFYRPWNYVNSVEEPKHVNIKSFDWLSQSMSQSWITIKNGGVCSIYPEWHPGTFSYWKNHPELEDHPTANLVMVNYLLQLGLTELLWDGTNLKPNLVPNNIIPISFKYPDNKFRLGIVPATKLAGRPTAHPGCNGLGLRYKIEHWQKFVEHIQQASPDVIIECFSETDLGLGLWRRPTEDLRTLWYQSYNIDLGVCSDGGMHHMFHACNVPTVLFTGTLVNKAEFFKTALDFYPEHLHLPCRKQCRSYFTEVFGGEDKSKTCQLECEDLDPIGLAEYTLEQIKTIRNLKDANTKS